MPAAAPSRTSEPSPRSALALGVAGLAALLASSCCVAPLALALLGISGAWIGQLRRIEPYSARLTGLALLALGLAAWRLYRRPQAGRAGCAIDDPACAAVQRSARRWFWFVAALTLIPILVPAAAPWFY